MRIRNLRSKLLLPILSILIICTVCCAFLLSYLISDRLKNNAIDMLDSKNKILIKTVRNSAIQHIENAKTLSVLHRVKRFADALSQVPPDINDLTEALDDINDLFTSYLTVHTSVAQIDFARENGDVIASSNSHAIHSINVKRYSFFKKAMLGEINISEPVLSQSILDKAIIFAAPVKNSADVICGVVYGILPCRWLISDTLQDISSTRTEYSYLVDGKTGLIIAHPNFDQVQTVNAFHYQPWMKKINKGEYGTKSDYRDSTEKSYLVAYFREPYSDWITISCLAADELDRQTARIRNIILLIMLAIIVAIASVIVTVITSLTRDIQKTNLYAQAIACGNFEKKLNLSRRDELGSLCDALHRMVEVLKHMILTSVEKNRSFQEATKYLYTSIYEIDVTGDRFAPESNLHQFENLDIGEMSYTESLKRLTRTIHKDYQSVFFATFSRDNILTEFNNNNVHLSIECPLLMKNELKHKWYRFDGHIFQVEEDKNIHLYLYARNIDSEIENEIKARIDELTGCLMRGAMEETVAQRLSLYPDKFYAFFILDIDNFKHANDNFGHAFGDYCLKQFSAGIKREFRNDDLIGRIGGDEFVVFIAAPSASWVRQKAESLVRSLDMICKTDEGCLHITASIGIALYPADGIDYDTLYRNADSALYKSKEDGKNTFHFFDSTRMCSLINKTIQ